MSTDFVKLTDEIVKLNNYIPECEKLIDLFNTYGWEDWIRPNGDKVGLFASIAAKQSLHIYTYLDKVVQKSITKYFEIVGLNADDYFYANETFNINKWEPPMYGMAPHTDLVSSAEGSQVVPSLTLCGYFTDDYVGGLLKFPKHNISLHPEAGSIIIFPSNEFHAVTDLDSGNRIMFSVFIFKK